MNAIVIEQDQEETKLAFEVHQNAAIHRIRLARAQLASRFADDQPRGPIAVQFEFKSRQVESPGDVLRLEIEFRMAGHDEPAAAQNSASETGAPAMKSEPAVLVDCAFEADYILREGFRPTPRHVNAFKDGNAVVNLWPYFREYLQSSLERMGLPPLAAPFLRLQPKLKEGPGAKRGAVAPSAPEPPAERRQARKRSSRESAHRPARG
jgi:hypothetical protein